MLVARYFSLVNLVQTVKKAGSHWSTLGKSQLKIYKIFLSYIATSVVDPDLGWILIQRGPRIRIGFASGSGFRRAKMTHQIE
jgi:hypothetical protein